MKGKRFLSILYVFTVMCSFLWFGEVYEANSYEVTAEEDFLWELNANGEVIITGTELSRSATEIVIPEKIEGKTVVEIADLAFSDYLKLKSVEIPKTVNVIGNDSFSFSYFLEEVVVASENRKYQSVDGVLYSKDKSELYYVPAMLTGEFVVPAEVDIIRPAAFMSCRLLESIRFSCDAFGKSAAEDMNGSFPGFFGECAKLKAFRVDEGHAAYKSVDGVLMTKDGKTLLSVPFAYEEEEYVVPEGVEEIEIQCFAFCENIESITLPNSLRRLEDMAFYGCMKIKEIIIPEGVRELTEGTFLRCIAMERISIPDSVEWIDAEFIKNCDRLTTIDVSGWEDEIWEMLASGTDWTRTERKVVEEKPTEQVDSEMANEMFTYKLTDVNSVVITGLTDEAKKDKNNRALVIPNVINGAFVVGIAEGAFSGVPLTSVVLPEGLLEIGRGAFYGCNLGRVIIPKSVRYIAPRAFGANYGLIRIDVEAGNETYTSDFGVLYNAEKTTLVQVPANYEYESFVLPDSVEIIEEYAFGNNRNIKTIQMKKEEVEIREKAFWNMLSYEPQEK